MEISVSPTPIPSDIYEEYMQLVRVCRTGDILTTKLLLRPSLVGYSKYVDAKSEGHPLLEAIHRKFNNLLRLLLRAGFDPLQRGTVVSYPGDGLSNTDVTSVTAAELAGKMAVSLTSHRGSSKSSLNAALNLIENSESLVFSLFLTHPFCQAAVDKGSHEPLFRLGKEFELRKVAGCAVMAVSLQLADASP